MKRREFLNLAPLAAGAFAANAAPAYAQAPFADEKTGLKITGVRIVKTRPRNPLPPYTPSPDAWSTNDVEVASPMSVYPEYKASRSLFYPDNSRLGGFWVEIGTDKGLTGLGNGGTAGGLAGIPWSALAPGSVESRPPPTCRVLWRKPRTS